MDAFSPPATDAPFGPPCPGCGRVRAEVDARGVAWSSAHAADGSVTYVCPPCTRAEISQIEAGLPSLPRRPAA
jgi:hypothetical protein